MKDNVTIPCTVKWKEDNSPSLSQGINGREPMLGGDRRSKIRIEKRGIGKWQYDVYVIQGTPRNKLILDNISMIITLE